MKSLEARAALGLPAGGDNNSRYTMWRDDVASYMKNNGIINRRQAGETKWKGLRVFAISHKYLRGYKAAWGKSDATAKRIQEALDTLLMDIRAKQSKKRRKAAKEASGAGIIDVGEVSGADIVDTGGAIALGPGGSANRQGPTTILPVPPLMVLQGSQNTPRESVSHAIMVHRIEPEKARNRDGLIVGAVGSFNITCHDWFGQHVFEYAGMIHTYTMRDLLALASKHPPQGPKRTVRNLLGTLEDPSTHLNPKTIVIEDDDDVEAWLRLTKADPPVLLVIYARLPPNPGAIAPQSPPPDGRNHINHDLFMTIEEPAESSSGDDGAPYKAKHLPRSDIGWQKRAEKLRTRRDRYVKAVKDIERMYKERFPDGLVEGDDGFVRGKFTTSEERAQLWEEEEEDDDDDDEEDMGN
jgi:hypothetical protein